MKALDTSDGKKRCFGCGERKLLACFSKDKRSANGYQAKCKDCDADYRAAKAPEIKEYKKIWSKKPEAVAARAEYKRDNPQIPNASKAKRRAAKLARTPKWLSEAHFEQIKLFYEAAASMTRELGIKFEVDHMEPLQGEDVSGLHVPWNLQVITAKENASKGNR